MKKLLSVMFACVLPIAAIVFELLPSGAVLHFAGPTYSMKETYSYFNLMPFGYANFGPFICAVMTVAVLILGVVYLLTKKRGFFKAAWVVSVIAFLASILPMLMFGLKYFTDTAGIITLILLAEVILGFVMTVLGLTKQK